MSIFERDRTSAEVVTYMHYTYIFSRLSFRNTSKAIQPFVGVMLLYGNGFRGSILDIFYRCKRRVSAFLIDETIIQSGSSNEALLWVVVEPTLRQILGVYISRHRNNMIVAEALLNSLIKIYDGKHTIVYSDGGRCYPEACVLLGLKHRLHSSYEKSIVVERASEYQG